MPQSQVAANPRQQEEEKKWQKLTRIKQTNKCTRNTQASSFFTKRGDHDAKKKEEKEDKEHGKTLKHEASRSINHKVTQNKSNTGTTAFGHRRKRYLIMLKLISIKNSKQMKKDA